MFFFWGVCPENINILPTGQLKTLHWRNQGKGAARREPGDSVLRPGPPPDPSTKEMVEVKEVPCDGDCVLVRFLEMLRGKASVCPCRFTWISGCPLQLWNPVCGPCAHITWELVRRADSQAPDPLSHNPSFNKIFQGSLCRWKCGMSSCHKA